MFDCYLILTRIQIHDLNNVPLVSGAAYVKWHFHNSTRADGRGRTDKAPIKDHKVTWRYEQSIPNIRMTVDRNGTLNEHLIMFEINQEYSGRERIMLGSVTLNLAEYAGVERETRRYLMQDSKINSTLKVRFSLSTSPIDVDFDPVTGYHRHDTNLWGHQLLRTSATWSTGFWGHCRNHL